MRTTVSIQDDLLQRAERAALETRSTLGAFIDQALRERLDRKAPTEPREPTLIPTYCGTGLQPGVDIDSHSNLLDTMEER